MSSDVPAVALTALLCLKLYVLCMMTDFLVQMLCEVVELIWIASIVELVVNKLVMLLQQEEECFAAGLAFVVCRRFKLPSSAQQHRVRVTTRLGPIPR